MTNNRKTQIYLFLSTDPSKKIEGNLYVSENNTFLTFIPKQPLLMGKTYFLSLEGIEDIAGNAYVDAHPSFKTFMPYTVFPTDTVQLDKNKIAADLGVSVGTIASVHIQDIDFITTSPEESFDKKWHTNLVAVGQKYGDSGWFQLLTIDAADPVNPKVLKGEYGATQGPMQVKLLYNFYLKPREGVTIAATDPVYKWQQRNIIIWTWTLMSASVSNLHLLIRIMIQSWTSGRR